LGLYYYQGPSNTVVKFSWGNAKVKGLTTTDHNVGELKGISYQRNGKLQEVHEFHI